MDETDANQNGSRKSLPINLPDGDHGNDNVDYDKLQHVQTIGYPLHNSPTVGPNKNPIISNNGIDAESNSYYVSEPSVPEDGTSQHLKHGMAHRLSDGSLTSRQPPRHDRSGTVTTRDVRSFHAGADNNVVIHNKSSGSSYSIPGDVNASPQQRSNENTSHQPVDHTRAADRWQRERQRFVNFASMSPENSSLTVWEPISPNVRRNMQSQPGQPEFTHQSLEQNTTAAPREIQSTIRIMEYSQRQRIRQRSQQSLNGHSTSQGSPMMRTGQWYMNGDRAHIRSAESDVSQTLDQTPFLLQNGAPFSGDKKQALDMYGSARREQRSNSFDTSMSMTSVDHNVGDIVDYSRYPHRTLVVEDRSFDDDAVSSHFHSTKRHSRSHSTNDTSTLGRRRQKLIGAVASQSKGLPVDMKSKKDHNAAHKQISSSRLHATSSFESAHSAKSVATRRSSGSRGEASDSPSDRNGQMKQYNKARRRRRRSSSAQSIGSDSRDGFIRFSNEDKDFNSIDSGSISDDEEDNGESSRKRRVRESNRIRGPSIQRPSPFANIGKSSAEKVARSTFLPTSYSSDDKKYSTFICPRCKTRQREFFTVENAAGRLEGPGSYLALYFCVYVVCSLFIFGLEEGWKPLDCIYFAVITLTTAGLVSNKYPCCSSITILKSTC